MSHKLILQEGAILIADAHYSQQYPQFYSFLQALDTGEIETKQLLLMGDMFELLFARIKKTCLEHQCEIDVLNRLSEKLEIIYFEGNHDFGLKELFPHIEVFPLEEQPQEAQFKHQKILLSHGDTKTPLGYQIYTKMIRNPWVLSCVGFMDTLCQHCIIKWLKKRGTEKNPCYHVKAFESIIHKRLGYLEDKALDIVIEGHFHQNVSFELYGFEYINLASFACNQKYFIVQSKQEQLYLQEISFKEMEPCKEP